MMKVYEYGDPAASTVLVQMADDHDLAVLENEAALIRELSEESGLEIPASIATLGEKEIRHTDVIAKEDMEKKVREILIG